MHSRFMQSEQEKEEMKIKNRVFWTNEIGITIIWALWTVAGYFWFKLEFIAIAIFILIFFAISTLSNFIYWREKK